LRSLLVGFVVTRHVELATTALSCSRATRGLVPHRTIDAVLMW